MSHPDLRERFAGLWARLGGRGDGAQAFETVLGGWLEAHRRYHGLDHLRDCLGRLDEASVSGHQRDVAEAALWYHDLVYQPGAADNESKSAERARAALADGGVPHDIADEIARLVLLTAHSAPAADPVGALVCDVDLSILGRPADAFAEYERRIREEYRQIPESLYLAGRARVLKALLARAPLFRTDHFRRRYEETARRNLRRSLDAIGGR
jgi:predicted metal-dependent HD superfamily phosphohydrolase